MLTSREVLGAGGPLAARLPGFKPRPQQQAMAAAVETALADRGWLVVEAGTGVGKTFAYLAPALSAGKKAIVSTGTRHLQDQLYHKDLAVIRDALGLPVRSALLKGRTNYLCLHRLAQAEAHTPAGAPQEPLQRVRAWAARTRTGDIAELAELAEDAEVWPRVTSTVDNCLGTACPRYRDCHVVKARQAAQEADVVVVNHYLLFADLALKEEGFGELLPSAHAIILDEAHQLPEIAGGFFGVGLGSRQLTELARDTTAEQLAEAADVPALRVYCEALDKTVADLRLALGEPRQRRLWPPLRSQPQVAAALAALRDALSALAEALATLAERGPGLRQCARRCAQLGARLDGLEEDTPDAVQWCETHARSFALQRTPLEVGGIFRGYVESYPCAWILTSATLSVQGRFEHFTRRLGLEDAVCECLDSPYDYRRHARLYLPAGLPEPADEGYTRALIEAAVPILQASRGRAFVLFTSHRALQMAARELPARVDFPLLVQGSAPRGALLERFRRAGDAILLGTNSFWEGVDVRGPALTTVIIDKLPFASPADPVVSARLEALAAQGDNPFMAYQLPQAVIALKQGVGRLIRDELDTGVLMVCDPRLQTRPYGRVFLASLPDMPLVRDLGEVETFLRACEADATARR